MPRAVISFSSLCLGIVMTMSPRRYMSWLAPLRTMARSTPASFALSRRALSRSLRFTRLAYQARLRSSSALGTIDSGGPIAAKTDQCSEKTRLAALDARDQVLPALRDICKVSTDFLIGQRNAARHGPTVRGSRHRLSVFITIPRARNCSGVAAMASACIRGVPEPSH